MSFTLLVKDYLQKLRLAYGQARETGEATPELSYRPILDWFFHRIIESISPEIDVIFEPKHQFRSGRPDWRFYNSENLGVYGYTEAKALWPEKQISFVEHQKQISKYLSLDNRLILTDGLEFIFFDSLGNSPRRLSLVNKPVSKDWSMSSEVLLIEAEFRLFFQDTVSRHITESQLITEAAKRAVVLSDSIQELSDIPYGSGLSDIENQTIEILGKLKAIVEEHHDPELRDKKSFARFVSQVLVFGLLYAHRVIGHLNDTPKIRYKKIRAFWEDSINKNRTDHLKLFSGLTKILNDELRITLSPIGTWYDDCCLMFAHVQLDQGQTSEPDYHHLFETFLDAFEPSVRFDFGAFYTPKPLAEYTVRIVEAVSRHHFKGVHLYDDGNRIIDPCCGTGTFLEKILISASSQGKYPTIIGFEILPGPYALAQYRMSMVSENPYRNLEIILTNTLSDELEISTSGYPDEDAKLIWEEQKAARMLSKPPLTLIIGNPPSADSSSHSEGRRFQIIENLLNDFRPEQEERRGRQNTQKQIKNDHTKFLRWSANKALASENSILALILPSSFAEQPSYEYARKWLVRHFSDFWIMDIDADGRSGIRTSSIFKTLQGRMLLIAINDSTERKPAHTYHYTSIANLRQEEKLSFLREDEDSKEKLEKFDIYKLTEGDCGFRPKLSFDEQKYEMFWPVYSNSNNDTNSIFLRHCSAIKLAPSALLVHSNRQLLERRSVAVGDSRISIERLKEDWFEGQLKAPNANKFTSMVRRTIGKAVQYGNRIVEYSYRPFITAYALIDIDVLKALGNAPGRGTRFRPEVLSAFSDSNVVGISVSPSRSDIGELHRFTSFVWNLPDNDLCKRGNGQILCNYFPQYKPGGRKKWDPTPIQNISNDLMSAMRIENPIDVIYYVYAILCSDVYLDSFEGALHTASASRDIPRIPIFKDINKVRGLISIGKKLAELEKPVQLEEIDLHPFFNKLQNLFERDFDLVSYEVDAEKGTVILSNDVGYSLLLSGIGNEVLEFRVSGYNVLQQWLKFNSKPFTRSDFRANDLKRFLHLLQTIKVQIEIVKDSDNILSEAITSDDLIVPERD